MPLKVNAHAHAQLHLYADGVSLFGASTNSIMKNSELRKVVDLEESMRHCAYLFCT
jgi:hypothetical protein